MALTGIDRGVGSRNTGGESTYAISPSGTIAAGSRAVLFVAYDNSGASGADPYSAISDNLGNPWNKVFAQLRTPGSAANDGLVLAVFDCLVATPITTSDTITVSFGGTTTVARAYALHEITAAAGSYAARHVGTLQNAAGASTTPSLTTASIPSGDLLVAAMGAEHNSAITADSDVSNGTWSTHQTSGVGVTTAGMEISSQRKPITGTGTQTYNLTITSADWASLAFAYREATDASAGNAAGTGAANNATPSIAQAAGAATGTGAAQDAAASVAPNAGNAAATGAAQNAAASVAANAGNAGGTGSAYNASVKIEENVGVATGSGAAGNATVGAATNANAATGTGAAGGPGSSLSVLMGVATGTGTAYGATAVQGRNVDAGLASGTGTARGPGIALRVNDGLASGTGAAGPPTISTVTIVAPPLPCTVWLDLEDRSRRVEGPLFELLNADLSFKGVLAVDRTNPPRIRNDATASIPRTIDGLRIPPRTALTAEDPRMFAQDVDTLTDRVRLKWTFGPADQLCEMEWGVFLFADEDDAITTAGTMLECKLADQTQITSQLLEQDVGFDVGANIGACLAQVASIYGLVAVSIEATAATLSAPLSALSSRDSGDKIASDLCAAAGFLRPHFSNPGVWTCRSAPDPADVEIDHVYGAGGRVVKDSAHLSNGLLRAPNVYIVRDTSVSNTAPVVGRYEVPASAPHSYANIGYWRPAPGGDVQGLADQLAADLAAKAMYAEDSSVFASLTFDTPIDPRHDTFDVLTFDGEQYIEQEWEAVLVNGATMSHDARGFN